MHDAHGDRRALGASLRLGPPSLPQTVLRASSKLMPVSWGDVLNELQQALKSGQPLPPGVSPFDIVRRRYLAQLHEATKRNVILYASKWTQAPVDPDSVSIVPEDLQGFMEVLSDLDSRVGLDLVLHSPGGSAEAAESIVKYVRAYFTDIRVIPSSSNGAHRRCTSRSSSAFVC